MRLTWDEPLSRTDLARRQHSAYPRKRGVKTDGRTGRQNIIFQERGHPLATQHGVVLEARAVLWDKLLRPDFSQCHWCGWALAWHGEPGTVPLQADHLNGDPLDNDPANLEPSCAWCNSARYQMKARFHEALVRYRHLDPRIRSRWLMVDKAFRKYEDHCRKLGVAP